MRFAFVHVPSSPVMFGQRFAMKSNASYASPHKLVRTFCVRISEASISDGRKRSIISTSSKFYASPHKLVRT